MRGTRTVIGAGCQVDAFAVIRAIGGSGDVIIGPESFVGPHCVLYSGNGIRLGTHVLLGPHVCIVPTNHEFARRDVHIRHQGFMPSRGGVVVEDDVWIGANSVILDGSYIEQGAIVAAGSVVRGRVSSYSIWGGVPAVKLRDRP